MDPGRFGVEWIRVDLGGFAWFHVVDVYPALTPYYEVLIDYCFSVSRCMLSDVMIKERSLKRPNPHLFSFFACKLEFCDD